MDRITYLIKRRGSAKEKTNAKVIAGAVMSIFIIGFALFPAFIFTGYSGLKTTGPYKVKETQAILIDKSRLEANENDGSNREIPIHFYYPEGDAANCPLVLFAHGSFGYYQSNSSLYFELASNGYVVASIDHPYYAFFTKDTEGKTIIVDFEFMQTAVNMQTSSDYTETEEDFNTICEWMSIRTADENFVLDSIKAAKNSGALDEAWYTKSEKVNAEILGVLEMTDTEKIGLTGHSIGGAAAVQLGRERDDITAVIDIDGTMLGEHMSFHDGEIGYNPDPYPIPVLSLDNARTWAASYVGEKRETEYVNTYLLNNAVDSREACPKRTNKFDPMGQAYINLNINNLKGNQSINPAQARDRPIEGAAAENKTFGEILGALGYVPERCSYRFASDPPNSEDDFAAFDEESRRTDGCIIPYELGDNEVDMGIALRFLFGYSYYAVGTEKRHMDFADIVIGALAEMACAEKTKIQDGCVLGRTVIDRLNGLIRTSSFSDCLWSFEEKWEEVIAEKKIKNPRSYLKSTLLNWLSDYRLEDFRYAL